MTAGSSNFEPALQHSLTGPDSSVRVFLPKNSKFAQKLTYLLRRADVYIHAGQVRKSVASLGSSWRDVDILPHVRVYFKPLLHR